MRCLSVLLLSLCFISLGYPNSAYQSIPANWNSLMDLILQDTRDEILRQNLDEVPLADAREEFRRKWSFILIDAEFTAKQGFLRRLSSIERRGDAAVSVQGSRYTLNCTVGLREAKVQYKQYDVKMWGESVISGKITGDIAVNTLGTLLDFDLSETGCVPSLRELKVTLIGGFNVEVSGLGPLDDLASQISTWISKKREDQVSSEMEYYLSKAIRKALQNFDCGQFTGILFI